MIKIDRVHSFAARNEISLKLLKDEYFSQLQNNGNFNPLEKLKEAQSNGILYGISLSQDQKKLINFLISCYKILILGSPGQLDKLRNLIEKRNWHALIYANDKTTTFGEKLLTTFGYENRFRSDQNKGVWLAKKLNIKSCPYCNSQYTLYIEQKDLKGVAKFQFDHFFPKERYPYFSVSFFNLIPSCAICNHKKSATDMRLKNHYHPYHFSLSSVSKFKVKLPDNVNSWNFKRIFQLDPDSLEITFNAKYFEYMQMVNDHNDLYDIELIFNRHKDIAHELLVKSVLYNRFYKKGTRSIKGLFPDEKTMLRYVLGNYLNDKEISKRPLSKFTQDIAKQLKLL